MSVAAASEARRGEWFLFAPVIFLSAFLLFQVQPIIGRFILPWFGGGSSVWITTLLFFQVALLAGYGYAHLVTGRLPQRAQAVVHVGLLLAAALVLPIIPDEALRPDDAGAPALRILVLLALTVGAPYVLLSTTGPLLQRWFTLAHPSRSPYRLYAVSNAGSLLALLTYPVLVEPALGLRAQAWTWSAGYLLFATGTALVAWRTLRGARLDAGASMPDAPGEAPRPPLATMAAWVALPAGASALLLAATNQLTQDVSGVPLLWVIMLAIYLVTFILCFSSDTAYDAPVFGATLAVASLYAAYLLFNPLQALVWQVISLGGVLFLLCMSLHGETARLRPTARHLTLFYLLVAAGGALGGLFVGLLAPLIFNGTWEYHVAVWLAPALVAAVRWRWLAASRVRAGGATLGLVVLGATLLLHVWDHDGTVVFHDRNFYGVKYVIEGPSEASGLLLRTITHGQIVHGAQYVAPERRGDALAYYGPASGVGVALAHPSAEDGRSRRVGAVGLGAGVVAAYAAAGESWTFYEIDPLMTEVAETLFTYLPDARARDASVTVRHGDARRLLERQLEEEGAAGFDILLVDAFSGDSIPQHLLTREAFEVYWQHLRPEGVLAVHVTNRHLDLAPVVRGAAAERGLSAVLVADDGLEPDHFDSAWVLVSADEAFLEAVAGSITPWAAEARAPRVWTDDRADLYGVIEFR
ncbi:MAG: fused MFS/spermidine synthase [Dehalococcoidia bacterium]|nr:fused MFS/spermidine synthase [Dehalococcoidia bacterium]